MHAIGEPVLRRLSHVLNQALREPLLFLRQGTQPVSERGDHVFRALGGPLLGCGAGPRLPLSMLALDDALKVFKLLGIYRRKERSLRGGNMVCEGGSEFGEGVEGPVNFFGGEAVLPAV